MSNIFVLGLGYVFASDLSRWNGLTCNHTDCNFSPYCCFCASALVLNLVSSHLNENLIVVISDIIVDPALIVSPGSPLVPPISPVLVLKLVVLELQAACQADQQAGDENELIHRFNYRI